MSEDNRDYIAAFAIGAMVGIGATLLLSGERTEAKRILYDLEPALKRARGKARRFGKDAARTARRGARRARRALRD
ncbi:MAG: hypothetical protein ACT443_02205 [Gemmatimonadota bacterium]